MKEISKSDSFYFDLSRNWKSNCIVKILVMLLCGFILSTDAVAQKQNFIYDGIRRYYEVHTPQDSQDNLPLVLFLHGWGGTIDMMKKLTDIDTHADTTGYMLVYVQGTQNAWNIDLDYCPLRGHFPTVDDLGYISALIDTLAIHHSINMERVYCVGWSTGGQMAQHMAGQIGHRFAAIASVGGGLYDAAQSWQQIKAMPLVEIHGTRDNYSQYHGPLSYNQQYVQGEQDWSVDSTLMYWVERNQCSLEADTLELPDNNTSDNCTAIKITYSKSPYNADVVHYKIIGGGHSWPGSPAPLPMWNGEGNRNRDINANVEIWNFLKNYTNPLADLAYASAIELTPYSSKLADDRISFNGSLKNPSMHQLYSYVTFQGEETGFRDSIPLFDDGLHADMEASDNCFGNHLITNNLPEDYYEARLHTYDSVHEIIHELHKYSSFTTSGPLLFDGFVNDTDFMKGGKYTLGYQLRNTGSTATATNIEASFESLSEFVSLSTSKKAFGDIAAGSTAESNGVVAINISEELSESIEASIAINIFSNGELSWIDTTSIQISAVGMKNLKNPEYRMYPNPADAMLIFEFQGSSENFRIDIFDLAGKLVLHNKVNAGRQTTKLELDISSLAEGIYYVSIGRADFHYYRKVIVQ